MAVVTCMSFISKNKMENVTKPHLKEVCNSDGRSLGLYEDRVEQQC